MQVDYWTQVVIDWLDGQPEEIKDLQENGILMNWSAHKIGLDLLHESFRSISDRHRPIMLLTQMLLSRVIDKVNLTAVGEYILSYKAKEQA